MSCCPAAPTISSSSTSSDPPRLGPEVQRIDGETEDCYLARLGNTSETGQVDDKTVPVSNTIRQNSVVPDGSASINLQFSTTGPTVVTSWVFTPSSFPGVSTNASGLLSGTFDSSAWGDRLTLRVQAMNGASVLDDRTYVFSPSAYDDESAIHLVHPLPGSVVTSAFGPRKPPTAGASSQHQGMDLAFADRSVADVRCAADGEVVACRTATGYGQHVIVRHLNGSGRHLLTTVYAHLDKVYVREGQKLVGGQTLGLEGSSGISSAPHLHFEARLPNGVRVDPAPYLVGPVVVADTVNPDNSPGAGTTTTASTSAASVAEVLARTTCEPFGATYPPVPAPPPAPAPTDPFEDAWYFTLTQEVNSLWATTPDRSPSDSAVAAGLINTSGQRERVGYVSHPDDPGGVTKFGVAQRFNPSIDVVTMDYATARAIAHAEYWTNSTVNCASIAATSPRLAVMAFDLNYQLGPGGCQQVLAASGVSGTETGSAELAALTAVTTARLNYLRARPGDRFKVFGKGWTRRAEACLAFAQAL